MNKDELKTTLKNLSTEMGDHITRLSNAWKAHQNNPENKILENEFKHELEALKTLDDINWNVALELLSAEENNEKDDRGDTQS